MCLFGSILKRLENFKVIFFLKVRRNIWSRKSYIGLEMKVGVVKVALGDFSCCLRFIE